MAKEGMLWLRKAWVWLNKRELEEGVVSRIHTVEPTMMNVVHVNVKGFALNSCSSHIWMIVVPLTFIFMTGNKTSVKN
jgi:hypothetical protein